MFSFAIFRESVEIETTHGLYNLFKKLGITEVCKNDLETLKIILKTMDFAADGYGCSCDAPRLSLKKIIDILRCCETGFERWTLLIN